jgi:hypothetical protein
MCNSGMLELVVADAWWCEAGDKLVNFLRHGTVKHTGVYKQYLFNIKSSTLATQCV